MQNLILTIPANKQQTDKTILKNQWQKLFGCPAPLGCHINFLHQVIGWHTQAQKHGGLTLAERKQLMGKAVITSSLPSVGSRLIRVWQGETHQISILKNGFWYADKSWKSLSAIAQAITGTRWSGPLFFGLKK